MQPCRAIRFLMTVAVLLALSEESWGQYQVGFAWKREPVWTPGTVAGSTTNNPGPDSLGAPVWQYEWVTGGPLGSANTWFGQVAARSVWDPDWFGIGQGAWARGDDTNPPVFSNRMTHNLTGASWAYVPAIRWISPLGDCTSLDLLGSLTVVWSGEGGLGAPIDAEVVIVMDNASSGTQRVLFEERISKPTPVVSAGESVEIQIDIRDINLDEGDSIIVSCRGVSSTGSQGRWLVLFDDLVIVKTSGEPCQDIIVAVFGDYGYGSAGEAAVADLVRSWDPDLIVTTGDNNYGDLALDWEKNVGAFYGRYILADGSSGSSRFQLQTGTTQRFFPSIGNHDTAGGGGSPVGLIDYFHDRTNGGVGRLPIGSGSIGPLGMYYDFVVGDAHFWIVDSDHAGADPSSMSAQKQWLEQGLASSTSRWNLVFFHHPPYTSGRNGNNSWMRWPFQQWGADMVFAGHDHTYERLVVSDALYRDFPFIVTGLGGRSLYPFKATMPGSVVRYNADFGAVRLTISPQKLAMTFLAVDAPAQPIDFFELSACAADCDRSTGPGTLDIFDFLCFQTAFTRSEPQACDCETSTGAGVCDIFDFLCFQSAFVAGCP